MTDTLTPPVFIARKSTDDGTTVIDNFHFFPNIHLLDFQKRYRVDSGTAEERQIHNLTTAMQSVNDELFHPNSMDNGVSWVENQLALGYCTLDQVPTIPYGKCKQKVQQYQTAVYAHAKALLLERHRDTDSRLSGNKMDDMERSRDIEKTADEYLQESREAIRALMDKSRCTIELL
jgi:hypothetical protein